MSSVADATGKFADRIVELLDIFDLSFFVSGAAGLGALIAATRLFGGPLPSAVTRIFDVDGPQLGASMLFVGVVASYAVGLGCFAAGRVARARIHPENSAALIKRAIKHHRVGDVLDLATYLEPGDDQDARLGSLYNRLWVHVRTIGELSATFALVKRYWVLAATFDGLGVALLLWLWPLLGGLVTDGGLSGPVVAGLSVTLVVSALLCWRQAAEYRRYQVDELVATVVHWHALKNEPADGAARSAAPS